MTPEQQRTLLFNLLDEVDADIFSDIEDFSMSMDSNAIISYLFYIRITEIYQGILILFKELNPTAAMILLRSLVEMYIIMKSSMFDSDFNDRHIKTAVNEKKRWLQRTIENFSVSGYQNNEKELNSLKESMISICKEYEAEMMQTIQLFERHSEQELYIHIYAPASMYVHGNRQSLNIYKDGNCGVKKIKDRDYSEMNRHICFSAAHVMMESYGLLCELIKKPDNKINQLRNKIKKCNDSFLQMDKRVD